MDLRIPPLNLKVLLGSNPLKSVILARRLDVANTDLWRTVPCTLVDHVFRCRGSSGRMQSTTSIFSESVFLAIGLCAPLPVSRIGLQIIDTIMISTDTIRLIFNHIDQGSTRSITKDFSLGQLHRSRSIISIKVITTTIISLVYYY